MSEETEELAAADGPAPEPAPQPNRGWFRPGDHRINREGRPRGSKVSSAGQSISADCAPVADRIKRLFVRGRDLAWRLTRQNAPWVVNLPHDFEIVGCRFDAGRQGIFLTIRSKDFPRIARGTPIPEFEPAFYGLKWRRDWG
jgi:hypothetical protein